MHRNFRAAAATGLLVMVSACTNANKLAMEVGAPPADVLKLRSMEVKRFDVADEKAVLGAATQTLQDLGFEVSESAPEVGVLVASKQRDAHETGQVVGAVIMGALFGVNAMVWDTSQTINVVVVSTPSAESRQVDVRVSFDRVVENNRDGKRGELIEDPAIYQQFFDKLSTGVALETQKS